jgi:hypothetical protein
MFAIRIRIHRFSKRVSVIFKKVVNNPPIWYDNIEAKFIKLIKIAYIVLKFKNYPSKFFGHNLQASTKTGIILISPRVVKIMLSQILKTLSGIPNY